MPSPRPAWATTALLADAPPGQAMEESSRLRAAALAIKAANRCGAIPQTKEAFDAESPMPPAARKRRAQFVGRHRRTERANDFSLRRLTERTKATVDSALPREVLAYKQRLKHKSVKSAADAQKIRQRRQLKMKNDIQKATTRVDSTHKKRVTDRQNHQKALLRRRTQSRAVRLKKQQQEVDDLKENAKRRVDNTLTPELDAIVESEVLFMKQTEASALPLYHGVMKLG